MEFTSTNMCATFGIFFWLSAELCIGLIDCLVSNNLWSAAPRHQIPANLPDVQVCKNIFSHSFT
jgi:hypothetical protein